MPKTPQSKLETETIIRWDESGELATLWTASVPVRNEWRAMGFPVAEHGGGWCARVPPDRIFYKTLPKSLRN